MFRSSSAFDKLLDKATSNLLLEPDWNAILAICDAIRSGDTPPKYAVSAIKKKLYHDNPHVVLYALQVMEACVKNCGSLVHDEVATKIFMEELREMIKHSTDESVKKKILELLQTWGMAFRNSQKYCIVTETLNLMKAEGWEFPHIREAEAMFEADTAPDWADGEVCHRCRVQFGMMTRQHHCRACGQVFCSKCSSRSCAVPKYGIEREVRVCESCFEKYGPKSSPGTSPNNMTANKEKMMAENLPAEYLASSLAQQSQAPPDKGGKTDEELKEEEELQLAIALSQSEAQAKEDAKRRAAFHAYRSSPSQKKATERKEEEAQDADDDSDISPELMRYLDRKYWEEKEKAKEEKRSKVKTSTAAKASPMKMSEKSSSKGASAQCLAPVLSGGARDDDLDEFVTTLKTQVEIFVNRMKSNSSRGRSITNDSSVQTLFMNTMAMHSKLLKHIQDQEDRRVYYEGLQDKLAQVKDARAALDALREEERDRKRREAEEMERLRQIQMREKLDVMRKKKQEYLQYQRQVALQRMQEQEREMKLRQEQVRQHYMMNQQLPGGVYGPGVPPHMMAGMYSGMPGMVPAPVPGPAPPGMPSQQAPYMQQYASQYPPQPMGPAPNTVTGGPVTGPPATGSGEFSQQPPPETSMSTTNSFNMQSLGATLPTQPNDPNLNNQQQSGQMLQPQDLPSHRSQPPQLQQSFGNPQQQQQQQQQITSQSEDPAALISFD